MTGRHLTQDQEPVSDNELDVLFAPLRDATHILVAVSGGPDSVAVLHLLGRWRVLSAHHVLLHAATVDHHLRGARSAREAADVAMLCSAMGIAHATLDWLGEKPSVGLPAAARHARYSLLLDHAANIGATHLVTGHTLDDQAETLLMRMSRGSGLTGLVGMRASVTRGALLHVRPFLSLAKARLVATCQAAGLPFAVDPTNANLDFARPRWRKIMPVLASEGLNSARLGLLSRRLARAEEALTRRAEEVFRESLLQRDADRLNLNSGFLTQEPAEIALRVLALALATVAPASGDDRHESRLERHESCLEALIAASDAGNPLARTLQHCTIRLDNRGVLRLASAPVRRRGINEIPARVRASLGKAADGA